jgi:hypothetical protein
LLSRGRIDNILRAQQDHAFFIPFILETYDGFGKSACELVNKIANHATATTEMWSAQDIKRQLLHGIFEELHLRNLRMMTAHLNRCHRPPPTRSASNAQHRRRQPRTRHRTPLNQHYLSYPHRASYIHCQPSPQTPPGQHANTHRPCGSWFFAA